MRLLETYYTYAKLAQAAYIDLSRKNRGTNGVREQMEQMGSESSLQPRF
jgi:hypothetical protein